MALTAPRFETLALNRVTFGARAEDIAEVQKDGWAAWVDRQLSPPPGDDPALAQRIAAQVMRINYAGQLPSPDFPGWPELNQVRPLNYLNADIAPLWAMTKKVQYSVSGNEWVRIGQELRAATWIRNTHSIYQLREFVVDFWNTHFNIGRQADLLASAALPHFDQQVIRLRALGNFRELLGAVTASPAMLRYLNNAESVAAHPNENFAREILELHTMGRRAYLGIGAETHLASEQGGFTDQDIIALSRALSGWTVEQGQDGPHGPLPFTGRFIFNPVQHSSQTGNFLGEDLSALKGMAQGNRAIDLAANHPATADFVCGKLCRRIFGDAPPPAVLARARDTWLANRDQPNQIAQVMRAILCDGPEIGAPPSKVRRPYERVIAFFRTTNMEVNAVENAYTTGAPLGDGIFVWPTPEGRPDVDAQWMSMPVHFFIWNMLMLLPVIPGIRTTLVTETPIPAGETAETLVNYWVGRMVGSPLRAEGMKALIEDAGAPGGAWEALRGANIGSAEFALRRLVSLIATSPEFAMR